MSTDRVRLATEIVRVCHRLYVRGLLAGTEGNVSARLSPDVILATTAGVCKGDIDETHIVALAPDGRVLDPKRQPSSEIRMHLRIYHERPDVAAVVHAHPPTATGFDGWARTIWRVSRRLEMGTNPSFTMQPAGWRYRDTGWT